jgi:hypothetical protein
MTTRRCAAPLASLLVALAGLIAVGPATDTAGARTIALGSYVPGADWAPKRIDRYARLMGRRPVIVGYYKQWGSRPFRARELKGVWSRGAVPMITWEPWRNWSRGVSLRRIGNGREDRYIATAARAVAAWDRPVLVRFAHEMNGDWYPWGTVRNSAHEFKLAWRRVVRIFRRAGADNVRWIWAPNVNQFGGLPFKRFYPGNAWTDWVALDGFNWGYEGRSYTFKRLFGRSYRVLAKLSNRPMMIAETGTYARGKARWIMQAMGRHLPSMRRIKALVWFNEPVNGVDMRFNSSRAALRAFRASGRTSLYSARRESLLDVSPGWRRRR